MLGLHICLFYIPVFIIDPDFQVTVEDHKTRARKKAQEALQECNELVQRSKLSPLEQVDRLSACVEEKLATAMRETGKKSNFKVVYESRLEPRGWNTPVAIQISPQRKVYRVRVGPT